MSPDPATPAEPLVLFTAEDGIGTMTINRPAARNAMDQAVQAAVEQYFEPVRIDGEVTDEVLASLREAAETLLSNPVIEDVVSIDVEDPSAKGAA